MRKPINKTVNIIGAGIAGLSVGCYLQKNGLRHRSLKNTIFPEDCALPGRSGIIPLMDVRIGYLEPALVVPFIKCGRR